MGRSMIAGSADMARVAHTILLALLLLLPNGALAEGGGKERVDEKVAARYRAILERNPDMGQVYRRLVELYGRAGGVGPLVDHYRKLVEQHPDRFEYHVILGHLLRSTQEPEAALAEYRKAADLSPRSRLPYLAMARLHEALGHRDKAVEAYAAALERTTSRDDKETLLVHLAELALGAGDEAAAKGWLDKLKRLAPQDDRLAEEVALVYERNGYPHLALAQWREILTMAAGDVPRQVEVLQRMADIQLAIGKDTDAERSLRRALSLVRPGNWNIPVIRSKLVQIYRKRDALRELIAKFQRSWGKKGYQEHMLLASLYDEIGEEDAAISEYRKAAALAPREPEPRLKLVSIFERRGQMSKVIEEYRALIAAVPGEHRYVLDLASVHFSRGDTSKALGLVANLVRRRARDPEVLQAAADWYLRYGERERALALTKKLVAMEPDEPDHLVSLGEQYFLMGKVSKALQIWKRIAAGHGAEGWALYGETLASHDRLDEAVVALRKAVELEPGSVAYRKTYADVLRRADKLAEARDQWSEILSTVRSARLRQEARGRIVALDHELGVLTDEMAKWRVAWEAGDVEAGRLLGLAAMRLKRYDHAISVWKAMLARDPGDVDALLALETCYARTYRPRDALEILQELVKLQPHRAKELYERMAMYALELDRDQDAVTLAARAVALNPDDASAHARLGDIHYRRQDLDAALASYRRAIVLDHLNFDNYFKLARIYLDKGRLQDAGKLYRDVVHLSKDDDQVRKAASAAMAVATMEGTLPALEKDLLPLLHRLPRRKVFVEILLDVYRELVGPLLVRLGYGTPDEASAAREGLAEISHRATKVLLDALVSEDNPMPILGLLALIGGPEAAVPLGHLLDHKDVPVRVATAVALGSIGAKSAVPSLARALKDPEREVREAAAWALGRIGGRRAARVVEARLAAREPKGDVRAQLMLALGRCGERSSVKWLLRGTADADETARAAAALAAGRFTGAKELVPALVMASSKDAQRVRMAAVKSLGGFDAKEAGVALVLATLGRDPTLRAAAAIAITGRARPTLGPSPMERSMEFVDLEAGNVKTRELIKRLAMAMPEAGPQTRHIPEGVLAAALAKALSGERDLQVACLEALDEDPDRLALRGLGGESEVGLVRVVRQLGPTLIHLAERDGEPRVRAMALSILSKVGAGEVPRLAEEALERGTVEQKEAALRALGRLGGGGALPALLAAAGSGSFRVRGAAIWALGRVAPTPKVMEALAKAAGDPSSMVREQVARSLGRLRTKDGLGILDGLLEDATPEVRAAAVWALGRIPGGDIGRMASDPSRLVRVQVTRAAGRVIPGSGGLGGRGDGDGT